MKEVWYNKLAKEGFVDIERGYESGPTVAEKIHSRPDRYKPLKAEADTLNHQFLYSYSFASEEDRELWAMYCKGAGRVGKHPKYDKFAVHHRMTKLKKAFKEWKRAQCEDDSGALINVDSARLIREIEEEAATGAVNGYHAMRPKAEKWDGGRWRSIRGGDGD